MWCVGAEMENSVFSKKKNPELSPNSNKICNLSFSLQVQRPVQVKAELKCVSPSNTLSRPDQLCHEGQGT